MELLEYYWNFYTSEWYHAVFFVSVVTCGIYWSVIAHKYFTGNW